MNTTFFRFEVVTLSAGGLCLFGQRHKKAPAIYIDLSFLSNSRAQRAA